MFAQIRGRQFIGHTGDLNCNQCGNLSPHWLFQNYEDEVLVFLKMGKIFSNVNAYCSICENSRYICSPATKREPAYCLKALHEHLDAGKEDRRCSGGEVSHLKWPLDVATRLEEPKPRPKNPRSGCWDLRLVLYSSKELL